MSRQTYTERRTMCNA